LARPNFCKILRFRVSPVNKESIANDLGISASTVEEWLTLLEASFIVFRLEPYFANINKRLIKSPKLYFYDVGLASHLLDIESEAHLENHPLKGNLFENMVVIEFLKSRFNKGLLNNLNFYRDKSKEVDLILREGDKFSAIEIKYAQTINSSLWQSLDYLEGLFKEKCQKKILVYGGMENQTRTSLEIKSFFDI
jgi:uncharacterized protein